MKRLALIVWWIVLAVFMACVAFAYLTESDGLYPSDNPKEQHP